MLPDTRDRFPASGVDPWPTWSERYKDLLAKASGVTVSERTGAAAEGLLDEEGCALMLSLAHFRKRSVLGRVMAIVLVDAPVASPFPALAEACVDEIRCIHLKPLREGAPIADCIERLRPAIEDLLGLEDWAFSRIRKRYERLVFRQVHDRGLAEEADEISQEVFTKVWQGIDAFEWHSELGTWIHRIVQNHINDLQKTLKDGRLVDPPPPEEVPEQESFLDRVADPDPEDPAGPLDKEAFLSLILKGMHILSPAERETLLLRYYMGRGLAEIAEITSTKEDTVRSRISKANGKLKKCLGGLIETEPWAN